MFAVGMDCISFRQTQDKFWHNFKSGDDILDFGSGVGRNYQTY